jgi:hypothetical protein
MRKTTQQEAYHDLLSPTAPKIFRMFGIATPKRPRPESESEEEGPYRPRRRGKGEASLGSQDGMSLWFLRQFFLKRLTSHFQKGTSSLRG